MGDFRIEDSQRVQFQALEKKYEELNSQMSPNSTKELEKVLETAHKLAGMLNQEQKKTENQVAKTAEEEARITNKNHVGTYRGWDFHILSVIEGGAFLGAAGVGYSNEKLIQVGTNFAQGCSTAKGWNTNRLEAQRSEHTFDQRSLDEQAQRFRSNSSQAAQQAQEKLQTADRIAQDRLRLVQDITRG